MVTGGLFPSQGARTSFAGGRIVRIMGIFPAVLELSIGLGTTPAIAATELAGDCNSRIVVAGETISLSWGGSVTVSGFEQLGDTIRRAPLANALNGDVLDISVISVPPTTRPSYVYLKSVSPKGEPFFPAVVETESYMSMNASIFKDSLTNQAPIVLRSISPVNHFPPVHGDVIDLAMTEDVVFTNSLGDTVTVLKEAIAHISRQADAPTRPGRAVMERRVAELEAQNAEHQAEMAALKARIAKLERLLLEALPARKAGKGDS